MIKRAKPNGDGQVKITFTLTEPDPRGPVSLVGSFNDWDPHSHPFKSRSNGRRSVVLNTPTNSTLHFRYLGEGGIWFDDADADEIREDGGRLHV